ncbi:hypothetical protein SK128_010613 [Halocaridina rubra]|uniref:Neurotransmitter-gated ion-channel ligand-binding domain-containing protein n=1 Tax=Halocaridina rubra TaxID=373956 RepID=A0AAN8X6K5_HALRR
MIYSGHTNLLKMSLRIQTSVSCDFEFHNYPWDQQLCSVVLHIPNINKKGLRYSPTSHVISCQTRDLEDYRLKTYFLHTQNDSDTFILYLALNRRPENYIWIIFLPTMLLLTIG